jgi:tetratricopeptide (TPR) repeat protein/2-polyprenyl-3-methyl-5-hydroxy-6-metoxy-1,4-benzoquinol methylase
MELTIDQALQKAVEAHKAGKVQEADRLYTAILKAQPKHPDANHNLGLLAVSVGKTQEALPFLKVALEANPSIAEFWLSFIDALIKLDRLKDAKAVLDQAKSKGAKGDGFDKLELRLNEVDEESVATGKISAEAPPLRPNILDSLTLHQAISLAKKKAKEGDPEEAKRIYQDILTKFPKNKRANDGLQGLTGKTVGKASKGRDAPKAELQSLMALYNKGQLSLLVEKAKALTKEYPGAYDVWNVMGASAAQLGQLDQAVLAFKRVLAIKPDYAEAYNNMGIALQDQGNLDEAIEAYKKALTIKPDYADAYNNMGNALTGMAFKQPNPGLQKIIISLLDKKTIVRPSDISFAAISLLKFEPKLKQHLQTSFLGEPEPKLLKAITDLSELPLLLKLMSVCPLPDLALENLLRDLRASLLLSISDITGSAEELKFQSALALQCFTNEYIYNHSEHEGKALTALEAVIKQTLSSGDQPSPQSVLCLASYRPLNQYDWSSSLRVSDEIEEVFTRQIVEPKQEANLKSFLPVLEEITDEVSSKVRDQYEVSPYPRWVNVGLSTKPAPISKLVNVMKLKLFDDQIKEVKTPNILIAGCGTGQHSIGTATKFKGSKVLAIDLSLASLSYAKRKTEELGLQNIDYMQADILNLGKLGRQFDIVESAGVLHHMDDPVAGWRILSDCLKPSGLMKIALYSELARQHIVEMRQEISKAGIGSSDAAMKLYRKTVMSSDQNHYKQIFNFMDFYSLSELKDLLFHVQEHRFTLPQIQDCLSELGLKFCGFESPKVVSHFKLTNSGADDPYNLDRWHSYEEANPRAFAGMYDFWCQKIA